MHAETGYGNENNKEMFAQNSMRIFFVLLSEKVLSAKMIHSLSSVYLNKGRCKVRILQ